MPAPLVIPLVEKMATATCFAERANRISENKYKITVGILDNKQSDCLAKMDKEMLMLKHEIATMTSKRRSKRSGKKEAGRGSPSAKLIRVASCDSSVSDNSENTDPKRRHQGPTMAERNDNERINNLQRRYFAQQLLTRSELFMDVKASQQKLKPKII